LANVDGRAVLVTSDSRGLDVETASGGKFGPDLAAVYEDWKGFRAWAESVDETTSATAFAREQLGSPSPAPRQIVAVGLNYREHAAESGFTVPDRLPPVFAKFVCSLTGPDGDVVVPAGGNTDWEVELVVVIGSRAKNVSASEAWDYVAGLSVGQDLSERVSQLHGPAPQFSLGKSFPSFTPVGPWLVTPDSVPDKDDLELGCSLDGEVVQRGRTRDLIFPVADLIAKLSETLTLYPGDLIFTGTPAGVGLAREPQRFIKAGEKLASWIEGIGELNQTFV
jgi:2-keto-4-pentenoate hydratase/2-oxohepta-3-ene-1,7-dioic acid hydratase in catechol pathway